MAENNNNNEGSEIPSQFSHSVKLEQTAKGVRITVHVSADNGITARQEAILLLLLSATTILAANASSKLPLTCDESSDDKECANFQIIVNQSHSQQPDNFINKPGITSR